MRRPNYEEGSYSPKNNQVTPISIVQQIMDKDMGRIGGEHNVGENPGVSYVSYNRPGSNASIIEDIQAEVEKERIGILIERSSQILSFIIGKADTIHSDFALTEDKCEEVENQLSRLLIILYERYTTIYEKLINYNSWGIERDAELQCGNLENMINIDRGLRQLRLSLQNLPRELGEFYNLMIVETFKILPELSIEYESPDENSEWAFREEDILNNN